MNTIPRTTTLRRLNLRSTAYQPLDKAQKEGRGWRAFSTRRTADSSQLKAQNNDQTMSPVCNKRDRARSRHIFLQGYKLSMYTTKKTLGFEIKLKKVLVKVKRMMVSVLSFMQTASLKRCNSRSVTAASSPTRSRRLGRTRVDAKGVPSHL